MNGMNTDSRITPNGSYEIDKEGLTTNIRDLLTDVEHRYYRYLKTSYYIRDASLRESFNDALMRETLSRGPFLEATSRFVRSQNLRQLLDELYPAETWDEPFLRALNADRPLFAHQEHAIRRIAGGSGAIIATGTGSGKTESFLLPILIHLYRRQRARPSSAVTHGVRALLLYPMNALVNDQRDRLRSIAEALSKGGSSFRFTFGQYIGATPDTGPVSESGAPGELLTREDLQKTPPDILITNYSMLEYLLLRPKDSVLFDHGMARDWRFLVLDEAHQYRGAKGMEMAMLLRRLKERLRSGGREGNFTCIATSASLGENNDQSQKRVAEFAQTLFGEPFESEDVSFGKLDPINARGDVEVPPVQYKRYLEQIREDEMTASDLAVLLEKDASFARLMNALSEGPKSADELVPLVFGTTNLAPLYDLVECASLAAPTSDATPLLPLRYHFFVRALEGVRVTFNPAPTARLTGGGHASEGYHFDLALCTFCGQHYLSGRIENNKFVASIIDPTHDDFDRTFYLPLSMGSEDLREQDSDWGALLTVCTTCGTMGDPGSCGHDTPLHMFQVRADQKNEQLECLICENRSSRQIREMVHGGNGPHVVIATALHTNLPTERRKILAFTDSRQRAATFAWYLPDTYKTFSQRNLLYAVINGLTSDDTGVSNNDVVSILTKKLREGQMIPQSATAIDSRRQAWTLLIRECVGTGDSRGLEASGLVTGRIILPPWWKVPIELTEQYGLNHGLLVEIMRWILFSLVGQKSLAVPNELSDIGFQWDDLGYGMKPKGFVVGPAPDKFTTSIDGQRSNRIRVIARVLAVVDGIPSHWAEYKSKAAELVRDLLEHTRNLQSSILEENRLFHHTGRSFLVNLAWWRWTLLAQGSSDLRQCPICHRLSTWQLSNVCTTWDCRGFLGHLDNTLDDNHYRFLYLSDMPGSVRVEEHTAQLARDKALQFQADFKQGNIHVLSSSTTFELGVDLGDLNLVFLRNVPPENFNYAQRVGRAGRRRGMPGVAITYCGRSPHDLYHFEHPHAMISGKTQAPVINMQNRDLIRRHWAAMILSAFFRNGGSERFGTVLDFVGGDMNAPDIIRAIRHFVGQDLGYWEDMFGSIIPDNLRGNDSATDWIDLFLQPDGALSQAVATTVSDWKTAKDLEIQCSRDGNYRDADWSKRRANQIARQDVIGFLSRNVVIPKYGFPVDVVNLEILSDAKEAQEVALSRDLAVAIAEYAPSAEVIANKKVWTSRALKFGPERVWPQGRYRRCPIHNSWELAKEGEEFQDPPCCNIGARARRYLIPRWGFTTDRSEPKNPHEGIERIFADKPFFVGIDNESSWTTTLHMPSLEPVLSAYDVRPGTIMLVSEGKRGQGFYICPECGTADTKMLKKSHKTPYQGTCSGFTASPTSLAHLFITYILRLDIAEPFVVSPATLWGIAYALQLGAAAVLDVPITDLQALAYKVDPPSVLIFDNVPGGAGLASQLVDPVMLTSAIRRAKDRVAGDCGCDAHSSCYACLRSYSNQWIHHELQRGPVFEILDFLDRSLGG